MRRGVRRLDEELCSAMISRNDGFQPVSFFETMDED